MTSLDGKVALVTGAGSLSGIGLAIAGTFLADRASVMLVGATGRVEERAPELAVGHPGRVAGMRADLTRPEEVAALVHEVVDRFGGLHVCVNNAGMVVAGEEAVDADVAEYDDLMWRTTIDRGSPAPWRSRRRPAGSR